MPNFIAAGTPGEYAIGKKLFQEYIATLKVDIGFQNVPRELSELETRYGPPGGVLLLAIHAGDYVGCAGVRRLDDNYCELKRMYVKPGNRGLGIGRLLLDQCLVHARGLGYSAIRLDTLPSMQAALRMYREAGFATIDAYYENPHRYVIFMEKTL